MDVLIEESKRIVCREDVDTVLNMEMIVGFLFLLKEVELMKSDTLSKINIKKQTSRMTNKHDNKQKRENIETSGMKDNIKPSIKHKPDAKFYHSWPRNGKKRAKRDPHEDVKTNSN